MTWPIRVGGPEAVSLLSIEGLGVAFRTRTGVVQAVLDVSFSVAPGEIVGVVGESGSGKSVTAQAVLRIMEPAGRVTAGRVTFDGMDLVTCPEQAMRGVRGRAISMVFQNPRAALNPVLPVGRQIEDVLVHAAGMRRRAARGRAVALLEAVRIADAGRRAAALPMQLSGGMCQRVGMAIALAASPRLLIADEPTTGLDMTTQAAIMALLSTEMRARGMALLLITHDLALAGEHCDRIVVMQGGRVVETGAAGDVLGAPQQDYTRTLVATIPGRTVPMVRTLTEGAPVLALEAVSCRFEVGRGRSVLAVDAVSLVVRPGEAVGLVGESGCGKSTLARLANRLVDATGGRIVLEGREIGGIAPTRFARDPARQAIQMVFQDATDSLDPHLTAEAAIAAPIRALCRGMDVPARVRECAGLAGLPSALLGRYPHQLSGGQKARVGIARALGPGPRLLVLDEPTSALDVSVQAVVLRLFADLRERLGVALLFISHDLNVVRLLCDRVAVMYLGQVVESGPAGAVFSAPMHPYTRALIDAIPDPARRGRAVVPDGETGAVDGVGCRFAPRCGAVQARCWGERPVLRVVGAAREAACHLV